MRELVQRRVEPGGVRGADRREQVVALRHQPRQRGLLTTEGDRLRNRVGVIPRDPAVGRRQKQLGRRGRGQIEVQRPAQDFVEFPRRGFRLRPAPGVDAGRVMEAVDDTALGKLLAGGRLKEPARTQEAQLLCRVRQTQVTHGRGERRIDVQDEQGAQTPVHHGGGGVGRERLIRVVERRGHGCLLTGEGRTGTVVAFDERGGRRCEGTIGMLRQLGDRERQRQRQTGAQADDLRRGLPIPADTVGTQTEGQVFLGCGRLQRAEAVKDSTVTGQAGQMLPARDHDDVATPARTARSRLSSCS